MKTRHNIIPKASCTPAIKLKNSPRFSAKVLAILLLLLLVGELDASSPADSLTQSGQLLLEQSQNSSLDYADQIELARQALQVFQAAGNDSLTLEAHYSILKAAYYKQDTVLLSEHFQPMLDKAEALADTSALVRAYNLLGSFYFSIGEQDKGYSSLTIPDQRNYYSAQSISENVFNLGALVDVSLGFASNLDTVYYYVNKLQQLARQYDDPNVQVVSRFKQAELLKRASEYEQVLAVLQGGYPYVDKVDNKGFAHYFYRILIDNFINLNQPDSARHYINVLREATAYEPDDPRNCFVVVSEVKANLNIGDIETLPNEFTFCYDQAITQLEATNRASSNTLNLLYVKCSFLLQQEQWGDLEQALDLFLQSAKTRGNNDFLAKGYRIQYEALKRRGLTARALEAHIKYKEYSDRLNQYVFSQSEMMLKNRARLQQTEDRNRILNIENQNQKLRITRNRTGLLLAVLGVLLLAVTVGYLVRLYQIRARKNEELGELVVERTQQIEAVNRELAATNEKLTKRNTELQRFAFVVSHDLKTPLHNVIKFAGLLKARQGKSTEEETADYLDFIVAGGKRMNRLIEDVLAFSLYVATADEAHHKTIDLHELLQDIQTSIIGFIEKKNAVVQIEGSLPQLFYTPAKVLLLFKNLIENGIKYNQSEEPTIRIWGEAQEEAYYSIFVADNGIGIDEEFFDKIFQMFARLHTQVEYEGSGLGLAICKRLVEEFQGQISVDSKVDVGTMFRLDFPVKLIAVPVS
ncbi:MAG: ATP-binding protein [Bacteroidota bacterium]